MGHKRGLVVFNFDECGVPVPEANDKPTYFQHGLSKLVDWRRGEAKMRFKSGGQARDFLPVVVISGSHSCRMTLLKTASGRAGLFDLGRPLLGDESLLCISLRFLERIAAATKRKVPETAAGVRSFCLGYSRPRP